VRTRIFANGQGVAQDHAVAVRYFRLAAEQGDAPARKHLGVCLRRGDGMAQDQAEAVRYFRLSTKQDDAHAQYNFGV
jgi:hypothetical protein